MEHMMNFFMPDDEQFWWNDLQQPKYFLINPDADHSQATAVETDIPSLTTFIGAYLNKIILPIVNWDINNNSYGNITVYFEGNTKQIVDAAIWHGRSCGKNGKNKRRDFRMISLDNPCDCGVKSGDYCLNVVSLWTPINNFKPVFINDTYAMFQANAPDYTDVYWEAFMVGLKIRAFSKGDNIKVDEELNKNKLDDESWFVVEYGEMVITSQVSIVQKDYPFADCSGESCKGEL
eukprot:846072_1